GAAVLARGAGNARRVGRAARERQAHELPYRRLRLTVRLSAVFRAALIAIASAGVIVLLVFHGSNWGRFGHELARMHWRRAAAAYARAGPAGTVAGPARERRRPPDPRGAPVGRLDRLGARRGEDPDVGADLALGRARRGVRASGHRCRVRNSARSGTGGGER